MNAIHKRTKEKLKPLQIEGTQVISIGNLSMGGTGKTPTVMFIAEILSKRYRIGVVSRGYQGSLSSKGAIVSDGNRVFFSPRLVGDEPFLIASRLPNIFVRIGKNKKKVAQNLSKDHNPHIILIDDGFQHYSFFRDLNIVLLDSSDPFCEKNGLLREPPSALCRADIIIFTRSNNLLKKEKNILINLVKEAIPNLKGKIHFFFSKHRSSHILDGQILLEEGINSQKSQINVSIFFKIQIKKYQRIFVLSGIANPHSFEDTVVGLGAHFINPLRFSDHHIYSIKDLKKIDQTVTNNDMIITTEKDWVKFAYFKDWVQSKNLFVLRIELEILEEKSEDFFSLISKFIKTKK